MVLVLFLAGCGEETYNPKPKGYFRIAMPEKAYRPYEPDCPFSFEIPEYAQISPAITNEYCWFNIDFPHFNARLHMSYRPVENNLEQYLEDSRLLAYKHTVKASKINRNVFANEENEVYTMLYGIEGNSASAIQFHITDSSRHFMRGSLYFASAPNEDSLGPAIEFIRTDVIHLIETMQWQNQVNLPKAETRIK